MLVLERRLVINIFALLKFAKGRERENRQVAKECLGHPLDIMARVDPMQIKHYTANTQMYTLKIMLCEHTPEGQFVEKRCKCTELFPRLKTQNCLH